MPGARCLIAALPPVGIPEVGQAVGFASLIPGRTAERESLPAVARGLLVPALPLLDVAKVFRA